MEIVKTCADYIEDAKRTLGNLRMSDRELGGRLGKGYSQQAIAQSKTGKMTDPVALDLAGIIGVPPGQILWTARMEREKDPAVREALISWSKTVAHMVETAEQLEAAGAMGAVGLRSGAAGSLPAGFRERRNP